MHEVATVIDEWLGSGNEVALATVIQTWGSAPRREGAKMALVGSGDIAGSVSGGCVEGAVFEAGVLALAEARPRLLSFGVADETAWEVGLACGGKIRVFVERVEPAWHGPVQQIMRNDLAGAVVTVVSGPGHLVGRKLVVQGETVLYSDLPAEIGVAAADAAGSAMAAGRMQTYAPEDLTEPVELFVDLLLPAPQLIMVGGVHIAIALAAMANSLGYRSVVVDPRRAFGSEARFPHVDRLIQRWPDKAFAELTVNRSTAVVMLTHDPKIDDSALIHVLKSEAFYVGALGSTRTHARRRERLLKAGVTPGALDRIHAPIGLDIGAQTPEEIAVAIMAEIVAVRNRAAVTA